MKLEKNPCIHEFPNLLNSATPWSIGTRMPSQGTQK